MDQADANQEIQVGVVGARVHGVLTIDTTPGYADVEALTCSDGVRRTLCSQAKSAVGEAGSLNNAVLFH